MIKILLENYLSIHVLKLEVVARNGHDALIGPIVNVARHGGPTGDTLDMVKHNPCILKVTCRLHLPHQVDTTPRANFEHLEDKDLVRLITLTWEHVSLNIGLIAKPSKLDNAIHDSKLL